MKAEEVQEIITKEHDAVEDLGRWFPEYPGNWLMEYIEYSSDPQEVPGLGLVTLVDSFGGEGLGDKTWFVFKVKGHAELFRIDGYYASYDGHFYDGDVYEVKPQIVQVTEYVKA